MLGVESLGLACGVQASGCLMPYCAECRQECRAVVMDFGAGKLDVGGRTVYDSRKALVSDCCESELFEDEELSRPFESSPDEYAKDAEADFLEE